MHIAVERNLRDNPKIYTVHNDLQIAWDVREYLSRDFNFEGTFDEINSFWSTLPIGRQEAIWDIYVRVREAFEIILSTEQLHSELVKLCKELYQQFTLDEVRYWVNRHSNIRVPPTLKDTYGPDDPKDRTYLVEDYRGLIDLSIYLRPMVPIWGEYLRTAKVHAGSVFKERFVVRLLNTSSVMTSPPVKRLMTFIRASLSPENLAMSAVIGGLGSEELPDWLLSLGIVKRLAVESVVDSGDGKTIISNLYNYLFTNTLKSVDRKFDGKVRDKLPTEYSDDDNASVIENYKMKQKVSDGDITAMLVYAPRLYDIRDRIAPELSNQRIEEFLHASKGLGGQSVSPHRRTIAQWTLARVQPPRAMPLFPRNEQIALSTLTAAILWEWGFTELSALQMGLPANAGRRDVAVGIEGGRAKVSKDLVEQLLALYPYTRRDSKAKLNNERLANPALIAIDELTKGLVKTAWNVYLPNSCYHETREGVLPAPGANHRVSTDIRDQLAKLIIKINSQ